MVPTLRADISPKLLHIRTLFLLICTCGLCSVKCVLTLSCWVEVVQVSSNTFSSILTKCLSVVAFDMSAMRLSIGAISIGTLPGRRAIEWALGTENPSRVMQRLHFGLLVPVASPDLLICASLSPSQCEMLIALGGNGLSVPGTFPYWHVMSLASGAIQTVSNDC